MARSKSRRSKSRRSKSRRSKSRRSKSRRRHRGSFLARRLRSMSFGARAACVAKGMISIKRKGKIYCRKTRSRRHLSSHAKRYLPTHFDVLTAKKVKTLKRIAKSKGIKNYSKKKKRSLVQAIMSQ